MLIKYERCAIVIIFHILYMSNARDSKIDLWHDLLSSSFNGPKHEKTCLRGFVNNKGADQPAHTRSLISAFVIRFLEVLYLD